MHCSSSSFNPTYLLQFTQPAISHGCFLYCILYCQKDLEKIEFFPFCFGDEETKRSKSMEGNEWCSYGCWKDGPREDHVLNFAVCEWAKGTLQSWFSQGPWDGKLPSLVWSSRLAQCIHRYHYERNTEDCSQRKRGDNRSRGSELQKGKISHYWWLWRWRKGPWAQQCKQPLKCGRGRNRVSFHQASSCF